MDQRTTQKHQTKDGEGTVGAREIKRCTHPKTEHEHERERWKKKLYVTRKGCPKNHQWQPFNHYANDVEVMAKLPWHSRQADSLKLLNFAKTKPFIWQRGET